MRVWPCSITHALDEKVSLFLYCSFGFPFTSRRNLDAAETRCAGLVSIIHRLNPDIDVEAALDGTASNLEGVSAASFETSQGLDPDVESTALSDRFEWRETSLTSPSGAQKSPLDGMASLPTGRTESGYLG